MREVKSIWRNKRVLIICKKLVRRKEKDRNAITSDRYISDKIALNRQEIKGLKSKISRGIESKCGRRRECDQEDAFFLTLIDRSKGIKREESRTYRRQTKVDTTGRPHSDGYKV